MVVDGTRRLTNKWNNVQPNETDSDILYNSLPLFISNSIKTYLKLTWPARLKYEWLVKLMMVVFVVVAK